jgi:hypothetical protein
MPWPQADQLAVTLVPYLLPVLVHASKTVGTEALKGIGRKLGDKGTQLLQDLWLRIKPEVEARPELEAVTDQLAQSPQNPVLQDELRRELQSVFEVDPKFMQEVGDLLDRVIAAGVVVSNVDIDVHAGKMENIVVDDLGDLSKAGIREIRADTRIQQTKEGSSTIGLRIGRLGETKPVDKPTDEE